MPKQLLQTCLLALAWLFAHPHAAGQKALGPPSPTLIFEHLLPDAGSPANNGTRLLEDQFGILWLGTLDGLYRYDGPPAAPEHYRFGLAKDSTELPFEGVWNLLEDDAGNIWAGDQNCLTKVDRAARRFSTQLFNGQGKGATFAFSAKKDPAGKFWNDIAGLSHTGKLARFDPVTGRTDTFQIVDVNNQALDARHDLANPSNFLFDIAPDGSLWTSMHQNRVLRLTLVLGKTLRAETLESPKNKAFCCLFAEKNDAIWLASLNGEVFVCRDGRRFLPAPGFAELRGATISSFSKDRHGKFWVGTGTGIWVFDPSGKFLAHLAQTHTRPEEGLLNNHVGQILHDRSGRFHWVSNGSAVTKITEADAGHFHFVPVRLAGVAAGERESIFGAYEDRAGRFWFGVRRVGSLCFDPKSGKTELFDLRRELPGTSPTRLTYSILEDKSGDLWFGTGGLGLVGYRRGRGIVQKFQHDPGDPHSLGNDHLLRALADFGDGKIWMTHLDGLSALDPRTGKFENFVVPSDSVAGSSFDLFVLHRDRDGGIWTAICAEKGQLIRLDPASGRFERFDLPGNFTTLCLWEDTLRHWFWLGTIGRGLLAFDLRSHQVVRHFTTADGLPNGTVNGILPGAGGTFWLATDDGLVRFDPTGAGHFESFGAADGVGISAFQSNSFARSRDGRLFGSGAGGFVHFFPDSIPAARADDFWAKPVLTGLRVFGKYRTLPGGPPENFGERAAAGEAEIQLSTDDRFFEIQFAAPDNAAPGAVKFRYHLEGSGQDTSAWAERNFAQFANLPYGNYVFRLWATDRLGRPNPRSLAVPVVVAPHFWERREVRGAAALAFLAALAAGIAAWMRRRNRRANQKLREQSKKAQLAALQAQMNPHFLFNALNTAAGFAATGERGRSVEYLAALAGLFREVLDESAEERISLAAELRFLEKYVGLQQERYPGKIQFEVNIDPKIDAEKRWMPPLLLQPLVENAIERGLAPRENAGGRLTLTVVENGGQLVFTVEDNGIGRAKSREMRARFRVGKVGKPHGLALVEERLALLESLHGKPFSLEIKDLQEESGAAAGTLCVLRLPGQV